MKQVIKMKYLNRQIAKNFNIKELIVDDFFHLQ